MFALLIDLDLEGFLVHFFHYIALALEFDFLRASLLSVEELCVQIEHYVLSYLFHVLVDVFV